MSFIPLEDRVLLRLDDVEETKGSIILPATTRGRATTATVVAVGPGRHIGDKFVEPRVKTGDVVAIGKYSGDEIEVDGEDFWLVRESDIFGVLVDLG